MRKIIAFSFVLSLFCSVYAEKITGFENLKFGCSRHEVENKMNELGYELTSTGIPCANYHSLFYKSIKYPFYFLGKPVEVFVFTFSDIGGLQMYSMAVFDIDSTFPKNLMSYYSDLLKINIDNENLSFTLYDHENNRYLLVKLSEVEGRLVTYLNYYNSLELLN